MDNNLSIEIRKFEARLNGFVDAEDKAIKALKAFINKVKESTKEEKDSSREKAVEAHLEVLKAFREAMGYVSKAEHERSHLLESYGSILLALAEQASTTKPKF